MFSKLSRSENNISELKCLIQKQLVNELIVLLMIPVVLEPPLSLSERRATRWTGCKFVSGLTDYNETLLTDLPHQHATEDQIEALTG